MIRKARLTLRLLGLLWVLAFAPTLVLAQTTTTTTTLSSAVTTNTQDVFVVASASSVDVGEYLYVDQDLSRITAVSGTNVSVRRNQGGRITPHVAGSQVVVGTLGSFIPATGTTTGVFLTSIPYGACTPGDQQYTVVVHVASGTRYSCITDAWAEVGGNKEELREVSFYIALAAAAGGQADQCFFIANRPYQVVGVTMLHATADASTTVHVEKNTGTEAPGSGTTIQSGTFDLGATANTLQTGTLSATASALRLATGERLCADYTGTIDTAAGVLITVSLRPL